MERPWDIGFLVFFVAAVVVGLVRGMVSCMALSYLIVCQAASIFALKPQCSFVLTLARQRCSNLFGPTSLPGLLDIKSFQPTTFFYHPVSLYTNNSKANIVFKLTNSCYNTYIAQFEIQSVVQLLNLTRKLKHWNQLNIKFSICTNSKRLYLELNLTINLD